MLEPAEGRDLPQARPVTRGGGALDEFALIAHEVRGPLAVLVGHLELARDLLAREHEGDIQLARGVLDRSLQNARELSTLTAQLIEARRLSGGSRLDEVVDLNDVMRAVVDTLPADASRRLALDLSNAPAMVTGHRLYLSRVAANLLDNALKYSPAGAAVRVATATEDDGMVVLTITDSGVGIADEELPRVLGRFERGSDAAVQRMPGSGLGLYIVDEIVRMHGGDLRVRSAEGKGTSVTVVLPRAA